MKRIIAIAAAAVVCLACAACGCTNSVPATIPSTAATVPSTMPNITLPTMETNIPDPEVNDNSTTGMEIPSDTEGSNAPQNGMNRSMMK